MLKTPRFGKWMGSTSPEKKVDSDERWETRRHLCNMMRKDENAPAEVMSRMITHMGANFRAYFFLVFANTIGIQKE